MPRNQLAPLTPETAIVAEELRELSTWLRTVNERVMAEDGGHAKADPVLIARVVGDMHHELIRPDNDLCIPRMSRRAQIATAKHVGQAVLQHTETTEPTTDAIFAACAVVRDVSDMLHIYGLPSYHPLREAVHDRRPTWFRRMVGQAALWDNYTILYRSVFGTMDPFSHKWPSPQPDVRQ